MGIGSRTTRWPHPLAAPPPKPAPTRTVSSSSAPAASPAVGPPARRPFPPEQQERILATVMASITRKKHLNPGAATAPTPGTSSEPATTPTGSNDPATTAPAIPDPPRSAWSTSASSYSQHDQQNDQLRLSGIGTGVHDDKWQNPRRS